MKCFDFFQKLIEILQWDLWRKGKLLVTKVEQVLKNPYCNFDFYEHNMYLPELFCIKNLN